MSLREKLQAVQADAAEDVALTPPPVARAGIASIELKSRIHQKLLERVDLAVLEALTPDRLSRKSSRLVERLIAEETLAMNEIERRTLVHDIQHEMLGLGPLEPLLADPTISDILVNTYSQVYVERRGKLEPTSRQVQRRHAPDARSSTRSSRASAAASTNRARWWTRACRTGRASTRSFRRSRSTGRFCRSGVRGEPATRCEDFLGFKSLTPEMAEVLEGLSKAKVNMLISGGTGSGKTTLLNILSGFIPHDERVVTIEDAAELQLQQPHVVRLETRPPNIEGKGEVTQRALVRNALRMRPDRIIVGEVRGAEALDMLQAMNTGHEGSMTTIHANTPRDALTRLENMIGMAGLNLPPKAIAPADQFGDHGRDPGLAADRRPAQDREHSGDHGHGRRDDHDAGDLRVPADRHRRGWQGYGLLRGQRRAAEVRRAAARLRRHAARRHVRSDAALHVR